MEEQGIDIALVKRAYDQGAPLLLKDLPGLRKALLLLNKLLDVPVSTSHLCVLSTYSTLQIARIVLQRDGVLFPRPCKVYLCVLGFVNFCNLERIC